MKFVLHTGCASPHVMPLARELVAKIGGADFRYVCDEPLRQARIDVGWSACSEEWIFEGWKDLRAARELLLEAESLYSGIREIDVFEIRAQKGLKTFYGAERWFRPITLFDLRLFGCSICIQVTGWMRMFVPSFRKMAKRFVRWIQNDPNGRVFTIGPWAKKDMLRLGVPELKIIPWGYFVAPSIQQSNSRTVEQLNNLKVLWVGRMLHLKRIDTIIRAVREMEKRGRGGQGAIQLTLVGDGPEKSSLQALADQTITFLPFQPMEKIREIMRSHDVYVLASNKQEGWGAVVSEALEEGMKVVGTYEAGASVTILKDDALFHAGDWRRLADLLAKCAEGKANGTLCGQGIGEWSAARAAKRLLAL